MYAPRNGEQLTALAKRLSDRGLLAVGNIYSVADLARINAVMDPIFASRANERRAYVRPDEMQNAGILDFVLSRKMKDLILSVVPNPVLYHFHAYEIAGNSTEFAYFRGSTRRLASRSRQRVLSTRSDARQHLRLSVGCRRGRRPLPILSAQSRSTVAFQQPRRLDDGPDWHELRLAPQSLSPRGAKPWPTPAAAREDIGATQRIPERTSPQRFLPESRRGAACGR